VLLLLEAPVTHIVNEGGAVAEHGHLHEAQNDLRQGERQRHERFEVPVSDLAIMPSMTRLNASTSDPKGQATQWINGRRRRWSPRERHRAGEQAASKECECSRPKGGPA
jgi:hypothetical protein